MSYPVRAFGLSLLVLVNEETMSSVPVRGKEYQGLLGMYEMEVALHLIVERAKSTNTPFGWIGVRPSDFKEDMWLIGFCQLLARGMFEPGYPNSVFHPTKELVERMRTRECWKYLADPPSTTERIDKMMQKGVEWSKNVKNTGST